MEKIAGCDFHPRRQQIAIFNAETGNISEHRLANSDAFTSCFRGTLTCISLIGMGLVEASQVHSFADLALTSCFCGSAVCNWLIRHDLMYSPQLHSQNRSFFMLPHAGPERLRFRVGQRRQAG